MLSKDAKHSIKFLLMSLCSCFFLISCGGGGGGGGTPAMSDLAITGTNGELVAAEIVKGVSLLGDTTQNSQPLNATGAVTTDQAKGMGIVDVVAWQMEKIQKNEGDFLSDPSLAVGVVYNSGSMSCDFGGTMSVSWNDSDNNQEVSAGDSLSVSYNNCSMSADGSAGTMSGSMSMQINSIDLVSGSFEVGVNLNNLRTALPDTTETVSGDMHLAMTFSGAATSLTASGNRLSYRDGNNVSRILTDYSMSSSTPDAMATWTYSFNGTLSSTRISGKVSFQTIADFTGVGTDDYPSAGELEITGAKPDGAEFNSSLYFTVLDNTQVRIEIDADGNGVYEITRTVNWSQLDQ